MSSWKPNANPRRVGARRSKQSIWRPFTSSSPKPLVDVAEKPRTAKAVKALVDGWLNEPAFAERTRACGFLS
jgi:hypothetical protein